MRRRGAEERVQAMGAIGPHDRGPAAEILHQETIRVKFNGKGIVSSELTDRK